jgi:hypothetical protein
LDAEVFKTGSGAQAKRQFYCLSLSAGLNQIGCKMRGSGNSPGCRREWNDYSLAIRANEVSVKANLQVMPSLKAVIAPHIFRFDPLSPAGSLLQNQLEFRL